MRITLFDTPESRISLLPLTFTRPVAEIRVGIRKLVDKWNHHYDDVDILTEEYLSKKYLSDAEIGGSRLYVDGGLCPNPELLTQLGQLQDEEGITRNGSFVAFRTRKELAYPIVFNGTEKFKADDALLINVPWQVFKHNREQIIYDFNEITQDRESYPIEDKHTICYNPSQIFIEEGVKIKAAILNAENGPIYLSKNSQVHEGAMVKGAFSLGEGAHLNMGAKVKGDTTVGPYSKVGGEVSNSVIFGYSNKGHDGFLGNSVIGEWCNLGADTNTSNLKNNYTQVKVWDYENKRFRDTGEQFCGLIMGDHSKCGINTMFNTGTVVGVGANIYGSGFPRTYIPSFAWGGASGMSSYRLDKFFETAEIVMKRRDVVLSDADREILTYLYELTSGNR